VTLTRRVFEADNCWLWGGTTPEKGEGICGEHVRNFDKGRGLRNKDAADRSFRGGGIRKGPKTPEGGGFNTSVGTKRSWYGRRQRKRGTSAAGVIEEQDRQVRPKERGGIKK